MAISKAMEHTTGANSIKQSDLSSVKKAMKRKREQNKIVNDNENNESNTTYDPMHILEKDLSAKKTKHDDSDALLLDRLHGSNALSALKDIQNKIESMKFNSNVEDPLNEFFQQGGTARDILHVITEGDRIKHYDVVVVFNACETILLHLGAQITSIEPNETVNDGETRNTKLQTLAVDLTREVLQNHIKYLMMFLSEKNSVQQSITSLRLLTAMVAAGGPMAGKEVLLKIDFEHPSLVGLSDRAYQTKNMSIRKSHLEFLVSFFVAGNASVIKEFLEKKSSRTHLASLFPGFIYDEFDVVQLVITTFHEKIINNLAISKTAKMQLFGVHNIKYILALFGWKGPNGRKENSKSKQTKMNEEHDDENLNEADADVLAELDNIRKITKDFFIDALTSVKKGLIFFDSTCGTSGSNQNQLLQHILQSMTSYKPWKEKHMSLYISDIVIKSLAVCPDQIRPYLTKSLQPLWVPKEDSVTWKQVAIFLRKIFEVQDPLQIVKSISLADANVITSETGKDTVSKLQSNILSNIFCNDKIYREVINPALQSISPTVWREGLELFVTLLEKIEELLSSKMISAEVRQQLIHRLSDKIASFQILKGLWKKELDNFTSNHECSEAETSFDPIHLKRISKIYDFYWSHFSAYSNGNNDVILSFMQDINNVQVKLKRNVEPVFSYIQLILLKRLAALSSKSTIYNGTETLVAQENLKVLVDWSTSDTNEDLALETISRILNNARMMDLQQKSVECLSIWFKSVYLVENLDMRQQIRDILTNCLSKSFKCRESLVQELNALTANYNGKETGTSITTNFPTAAQDEDAFFSFITNPNLKEMINFKGTELKTEKRLDVFKSTREQAEATPLLTLCPIELAFMKCTELQDVSLDYFSTCLYTLITLQDEPKTICDFILDKKAKLFSNNVRKLVKSYLDQTKTPKYLENESPDKFLWKLKIHRDLHNLKQSDPSNSKFATSIQKNFERIEDLSFKKMMFLDISKQQSLNKLFNPFLTSKETNRLIINVMKQSDSNNVTNKYLDKLVSSFIEYFNEDSNSMWNNKNVIEIQTILEESMEILVNTPKEVNILFRGIRHSLPPVMKISKEENMHLRCVMSQLLQSFTKLDYSTSENSEFITYVTNLMELMLSGSVKDIYNESLLKAINEILLSCPKMMETLSSVHISLAVKSSLQCANQTIVLLIKNSDKFAKSYRKLVVKDTNDVKNLEKFLLATTASLKYKADVKSKFIKEVKKVIQPEITSILRNSDSKLPNHAIGSLLDLMNMLINDYDVEFEQPDLQNSEISNVSQIQILNALFGAQDNDDELKTHLLIPSLKVASNLLKIGFVEDECQLKSVFDIIDKRIEDVHSLTSFYTNSGHNEVWNKFVKSVLKNSLKTVSSATDHNLVKRGSMALSTLNKMCKKLYSISNTRKKKTRGWKESADEDCQLIFNMVCGHSSFLGLLYSKSKISELLNLKNELLRLLLLLMETYPKICEDLELPVFLGAYHATLSESDCLILKIIQRCETETSGEGKINKLAMYQPLLWGQAAASKYSTLHSKISKSTRTSEVLQLIEPERMLRSALKFPLQAKIEFSEDQSIIDYDASYYDPRFFIPLICHLCSPDAYIDKHLKLIESGVLALVFGSFSSHDSQMRALGCTALCRIYNQMASAKKALSAEKQIWLHLIEVARNGLAQQIDESNGVPKRVPSIATSFLIRATTVLSSPLDPMYKSISSFILAKPTLDMFGIPNFLRLFHSKNIRQPDEDGEKVSGGGISSVNISNTQHITERNWILTVIRDGLRDMLDFNILQQNFVFKILLTFYGSMNENLRSDASKSIILNILKISVGIKDKGLDLIKRHGFLIWILDQITNAAEKIASNGNVDEYEKEFIELTDLVHISWNAVRNMFNNTQIITDEKLTLAEFKNTATNVILLTAKSYTSRTAFMNQIQGMVNVVNEIEQIRNHELQDEVSVINTSLQNNSLRELLYSCFSSFDRGDNNEDRIYYSEKKIQSDIENIINSCDKMTFKIDK